jgi:hypothetical protein
MPQISRPTIFSLLIFATLPVTLANCQIIGGLDALHLSATSGGNGGAGDAGAAGNGGALTSTGTNGVGGAGGGPPTTVLWSKRFGDATTQTVTDVAVDAMGNIFVVGSFLGTLDFGTGTALVSAGDYDAFLAKLDPDGNPLWGVRFGGLGPDRIESVQLTTTGDPVVGGSFGAAFSIAMKPITYAGGLDGFVMRFSGANGALVWNQRFGDTQNQRCASVAVATNADDVYCLADFSGTVDFTATKFTSSGLEDLVAIRYSATGTFFSALHSGDALGQTARSIVVNGAGAAYVTARFDGVIDWGPTPLTSAGQGDVFLGKVQDNGLIPWTLRMGDSNTQQPNGLALVPGAGGIALVGDFEGFVDLGGKAITSKGGFDAFIARVDGAGVVSWIRSIGDGDPMATPDDQYATDVAAMDDGTLFVTGYIAGTVDFGSNLISGPGDTDFFVMRIDSTGKTLWGLRSGSDNSQFGRAIALSGTTDLVVAGDFRNTLDLGNGPLTSAGSNDIFIAKLSR